MEPILSERLATYNKLETGDRHELVVCTHEAAPHPFFGEKQFSHQTPDSTHYTVKSPLCGAHSGSPQYILHWVGFQAFLVYVAN